MIYSDNELNNLHKTEVEILDEIVRICNKFGIKYYLIGGSCLGAVRHQGFIPWDDDIDIAMPRPYYERFLQIAQNELPKHLFMQCWLTEPDYRQDFAKVRNSETTFIEMSSRNLKINHGMYVDIFPIDGVPKKSWAALMLNTHKATAKRYLGKDYVAKRSFLSKVALMISCFLMGFQKTEKVLSKLEKHYKKFKYDNSELVICHGGAWGKKEIHPRTQFGNGRVAKFEGRDVIIPEKAEDYLRWQYGDWEKLPPENRRIAHHFCDVIDLSKPYTYYINSRDKNDYCGDLQ